jgi:hypothetical protein
MRVVIHPNIDVYAQYSLQRMLKGNPLARTDASQMLAAVKSGLLAGICKEDEEAPALRARKMGMNWWELITPGEDSMLVLDPHSWTKQPMIIFRDSIRSIPQRLDPALRRAWGAFKLLNESKNDTCKLLMTANSFAARKITHNLELQQEKQKKGKPTQRKPLPKNIIPQPPDYPGATRFILAKSLKKMSIPRVIDRIVIHITDSLTLGQAINQFKNPRDKNGKPIEVSAHYIVDQTGEIVQMVRENDIAFHAGKANSTTIGIEHVARSRKPSLIPTPEQHCNSAALVNYLCDKYGIPEDRDHIVGHSEADAKTLHHDCPSSVWDWDRYMNIIKSRTCTALGCGL